MVAWFVKLRGRWSYIRGWCFVVGNKFRYMRACFDRNQSTRMVLVASHFIVARSKYLKLVVREPWRMKQVMNKVSKWLDSPECRYLTYCYLRLSELVKENKKKKARTAAKDRGSKLRGRRVVAKFCLRMWVI